MNIRIELFQKSLNLMASFNATGLMETIIPALAFYSGNLYIFFPFFVS